MDEKEILVVLELERERIELERERIARERIELERERERIELERERIARERIELERERIALELDSFERDSPALVTRMSPRRATPEASPSRWVTALTDWVKANPRK